MLYTNNIKARKQASPILEKSMNKVCPFKDSRHYINRSLHFSLKETKFKLSQCSELVDYTWS